MSNHLAPRPSSRIPRANIDPVANAADALALISLVIAHPLAHETVVIVLDDERRGEVITVVSGTEHADMCAIVEAFCEAAISDTSSVSKGWMDAASMIVATVRPDGATRPGDVDRWLEASALADTFGLDLLEWFVIGPSGAECPRDLIGELERW